jgi:hypothetical protein
MNSNVYHFPLLLLIPDFPESEVERSPFRIAKRRWQTSIFDLATLATRHKLHLPYQVMDVFLSRCNLELCLTEQASIEEANATFQAFRLALYASGLSPFISPFITTHSINEYSGINSRDSEMLREKLNPDMAEGLKSGEDTLKAWPLELSFQCIILKDDLKISEGLILDAAAKANSWKKLIAQSSLLKVVEDVANSAPKLLSLDQSLLHIWSALEALFPSVNTELSFRLAIYLAQLLAPKSARLSFFEKVRDAYNLRSKITHGARRDISIEEWQNTWSLLMGAVNAVIQRGSLPTEKELISELFG